jgi:hypothetical protein
VQYFLALPLRGFSGAFLDIFGGLFDGDFGGAGRLFQVLHGDVIVISVVFLGLAAVTAQTHGILLSSGNFHPVIFIR